jgi:L-ascorbate metabolism protein UlaG (beta-lactamase superfamily)
MPVEQLPGLHFIVLPHHHGDHFDHIAARRLDHNLPVITEPHTARRLTSQASAGRSPCRPGKRRLSSEVTTK